MSDEWAANSPFPVTTITGLDDTTGTYSQVFADARWGSAVGGDEQDRDVVAQVTPVGGCFE